MASRRAKLAFLTNQYRSEVGRQRLAIAAAARAKKHVKIFRGIKRQSVIGDTVTILSQGNASLFEFEASCRHSLRSILCARGYPWQQADVEAREIVSAALFWVGAVRPNWEQGQREYTTAHEDCNYCGVPLPSEMRRANRRGRYCSVLCAERAISMRSYPDSYANSETGMAAYKHLVREQRPSLSCERCMKSYKPFSPSKQQHEKQRFCSLECKSDAARIHADRNCLKCGTAFRMKRDSNQYCSFECSRSHVTSRACEQCGSGYESSSPKARFCSTACAVKTSRLRRQSSTCNDAGFLKTCTVCERSFTAKLERALYCGSACGSKAARRKKTGNPQSNIVYLTAEIFDGWFQEAA